VMSTFRNGTSSSSIAFRPSRRLGLARGKIYASE